MTQKGHVSESSHMPQVNDNGPPKLSGVVNKGRKQTLDIHFAMHRFDDSETEHWLAGFKQSRRKLQRSMNAAEAVKERQQLQSFTGIISHANNIVSWKPSKNPSKVPNRHWFSSPDPSEDGDASERSLVQGEFLVQNPNQMKVPSTWCGTKCPD